MTFRPSQRGQETTTVSWWAQLSWAGPDPRDVWTTQASPTFGSEREAAAWVAHNRGTAEVHLMRREATPGGFRDFPLVADDEAYPSDPERLRAVLAPLRVLIDAKRPTRRMTAPSEWSLRRAVAALTPPEPEV